MANLPRYVVRLTPGGVEVDVDGTTVPGVTAVHIEGGADRVPRVVLEALAEEVHVEGVGTVDVAYAGDPIEALDELLGALDPGVIEAEVLQTATLGRGSVTGDVIEAIRRQIRGG